MLVCLWSAISLFANVMGDTLSAEVGLSDFDQIPDDFLSNTLADPLDFDWQIDEHLGKSAPIWSDDVFVAKEAVFLPPLKDRRRLWPRIVRPALLGTPYVKRAEILRKVLELALLGKGVKETLAWFGTVVSTGGDAVVDAVVRLHAVRQMDVRLFNAVLLETQRNPGLSNPELCKRLSHPMRGVCPIPERQVELFVEHCLQTGVNECLETGSVAMDDGSQIDVFVMPQSVWIATLGEISDRYLRGQQIHTSPSY